MIWLCYCLLSGCDVQNKLKLTRTRPRPAFNIESPSGSTAHQQLPATLQALFTSMAAQMLLSHLAGNAISCQLLPAAARAFTAGAACGQSAKRQAGASSAALSQEALVAQLQQQNILSKRAAE
jgi:hypothetical protein